MIGLKDSADRIYYKIARFQATLSKLDDKELSKQFSDLKQTYKNFTEKDKIFPEMFALAREMARRTIKNKPFAYREQIIAAIYLRQTEKNNPPTLGYVER